MDEKLLNRLEALGGVLICVSYFLPWASMMTPFGSIEVRGLYVDYAWMLLILAILHLLAQFARLNKVALGLPDEFSKGAEFVWLSIPFVFIAFFVWYGARFIFHSFVPDSDATLFGVSVASTVRAGLDYGYWIGALGTILVVGAVALLSQKIRMIATYAIVAAVVACVLSFAVSIGTRETEPPSALQASANNSSPSNTTPPDVAPQPALDASPFVIVMKITGAQLPKDLDAGRYNDSIVVTAVFKNVGKKTIVGLQGRISVLDGFNKEVYGFNFRDDDKIAPGAESDAGYNFDGNQFEETDPYHLMLPVISGGTVKYSSKVLRIAFDDGSVLPKQ